MSCLDKIAEEFKGKLSRFEVESLLKEVLENQDLGLSKTEILDTLDDALKDNIKNKRRLNLYRQFSKEQDIKNFILKGEDPNVPRYVGSPIQDNFYHTVRNHLSLARSKFQRYSIDLESKLSKDNLIEFYRSGENDYNIAKELDAYNRADKNARSSKSVTGDINAYKTAKAITELYDDALSEISAHGGAAERLDGFITENDWSQNSMIKYSFEEFIADMRKSNVTYNGKSVDEIGGSFWKKFYENTRHNHYFTEEKHLKEFLGKDRSRTTLAEMTGRKRKIKIPSEHYESIASKYFEGKSISDRVTRWTQSRTNMIADLSTWGPDPVASYDNIIQNVISSVKASDQKGLEFFRNKPFLEGLKAHVFRTASVMPDPKADRMFARLSALARSGKSAVSLAGSVFTQFLDVANAAMTVAYRNNSSVFAEMFDTIGSLFSNVDVKIRNKELNAFVAGMDSFINDSMASMRYDLPDEAPKTDAFIGKVDKVFNKIFDFNGMEALTRKMLKSSYLRMTTLLGQYADTGLDKMHFEMKEIIEGAGISSKEWDFLRQNVLDDLEGKAFINPNLLDKVNLDKIKTLRPDLKSETLLRKARTDLLDKVQVFLFKEANNMTILPDRIDEATLIGGLKPGTKGGEFRRFRSQFQSFSIAFTRRILTPLIKRGKVATLMEGFAALYTLAVAKTWLQDMIANKTPRDMRKWENQVGVIGTIMGFPLANELTSAITDPAFGKSTVVDVAIGPVLADLSETALRAGSLLNKTLEGEVEGDDFAKAGLRTFGSTPAIATHPIFRAPYKYLFYNKVMESIDPGYTRKAEKRLNERGQETLFR